MIPIRRYNITILLIVLTVLSASFSYAQIKIKFLVLNPSETEKKVIPVKYYLPPEITPPDVVDAGGLTIDYDVDEGHYFVKGDVELGPKETRTFVVDVRDIWRIPKEKLDLIREHVEGKLAELEANPEAEASRNLANNILKRVSDIETSQTAEKPITERVEAYATNKMRIDAIENDMMILNNVAVKESEERVVTIKVEVQNPYEKEYEFPVRYYLPPELKEADVVDGAGLSTSFDMANNRVFLKGDAKLKGKETIKYEVKVKDVWYIKDAELNAVDNETGKILDQLVDTEYEKLGAYLANEISALLKQIRETQKTDLPLKKRIAAYKDNMQKFDTVIKHLDRLRSFMLQFELARSGQEGIPTETGKKSEVTFGGGKAEGKGGGVGQGMGSAIGKGRGQTSQQRGGGVQGIRGLKGIILVSQSVFKGWKPEIATTWIIILTIIGFLFVFAILFYILWIILAFAEKKKEVFEDPQVTSEPKKKSNVK
ncbi:MAG: hypothetical protein PHS37_07785 [Candidatus Omnitrophica bacterium]|nr:hypothetical protein [Candidatus Omnitrophota bacterium]